MNRFRLGASIFQVVVGALAIAAYFAIVFSDESITNWIATKWNITLILAIVYVAAGIFGIVDAIKNK